MEEEVEAKIIVRIKLSFMDQVMPDSLLYLPLMYYHYHQNYHHNYHNYHHSHYYNQWYFFCHTRKTSI